MSNPLVKMVESLLTSHEVARDPVVVQEIPQRLHLVMNEKSWVTAAVHRGYGLDSETNDQEISDQGVFDASQSEVQLTNETPVDPSPEPTVVPNLRIVDHMIMDNERERGIENARTLTDAAYGQDKPQANVGDDTNARAA